MQAVPTTNSSKTNAAGFLRFVWQTSASHELAPASPIFVRSPPYCGRMRGDSCSIPKPLINTTQPRAKAGSLSTVESGDEIQFFFLWYGRNPKSDVVLSNQLDRDLVRNAGRHLDGRSVTHEDEVPTNPKIFYEQPTAPKFGVSSTL